MIAAAPNSDSDRAPSGGAGGNELTDVAAEVVTRGLPLAAGLHAYSLEAPSFRIRAALRRLSHELDAGTPLHDALLKQGPAVPAYLRGLIAAGARAGRFGEVVEQHLLCLRRTRDVRARVWLSLSYPLLLLIGGVALMLVMLVWPVPMFRGIFEDFGVPLPGPTLALMWLSEAAIGLLRYWFPTLIVLASLVALVCLLRFVPGRATRTRMFQMIPFVGTAMRYVGMSEFCSLLSILLECRVPLPDALRLTAGAIRDPNLAEGSRLLADDVESGLDVDDSVRHLPHFPLSLATMFRWSGRETALAQGLRAAGELFALQSRVQAGVIGVFVQPLVFLGVALTGGLVMFSLFMPLFSLLNELA